MLYCRAQIATRCRDEASSAGRVVCHRARFDHEPEPPAARRPAGQSCGGPRLTDETGRKPRPGPAERDEARGRHGLVCVSMQRHCWEGGEGGRRLAVFAWSNGP